MRDEWHHVEKNWDKLSKITTAQQVSAGSLVSWKVRFSSQLKRMYSGNSCIILFFSPLLRNKALAINPATFSPEFLLNVGRVAECTDALVLQPLHRPGAVEISFGGALEEEEYDLPEVETFDWAEIFSGDWRVVT